MCCHQDLIHGHIKTDVLSNLLDEIDGGLEIGATAGEQDSSQYFE
jgi:hypothetical protein